MLKDIIVELICNILPFPLYILFMHRYRFTLYIIIYQLLIVLFLLKHPF